MRPIGILGGMGPEASADVYLKIIKQSYGHAAENMDAYPHILINNVPTPNIFQRFSKETGIYLGEQAHILEVAGAKAIGVACNSAHYFWGDIRAALSPDVWLVDMIAEVAKHVEKGGFKQAGILSSSMSRPLYVKALSNRLCKITPLKEIEQEQTNKIISRILAGERTTELRAELHALAECQMDRGSECVVLGCTDLPVVLSQADVPFPLIASNDVLANVLFDFAVNGASPSSGVLN
jgi:aspartate racemase